MESKGKSKLRKKHLIFSFLLQAALVIRGLGILGFDCPRIVKWAKTADNDGKFVYLWIPRPKMVDLVFAVHEFLRNVTPTNNERHL